MTYISVVILDPETKNGNDVCLVSPSACFFNLTHFHETRWRVHAIEDISENVISKFLH